MSRKLNLCDANDTKLVSFYRASQTPPLTFVNLFKWAHDLTIHYCMKKMLGFLITFAIKKFYKGTDEKNVFKYLL